MLLSFQHQQHCFIVYLESDGDPLLVGTVFLEIAPYFKLYTSYVSEFETQTRELKKQRCTNPQFADWLSKKIGSMDDKHFDLNTVLVTPVQRMPRYLMILKRLLRFTDNSHPDYAALCKAVESVAKIVEIVDHKAKDSENVVKLMRVFDKFKGLPDDLLDGQRKLIKFGKGKSKRQKRFSHGHVVRSSSFQKETCGKDQGRFIAF